MRQLSIKVKCVKKLQYYSSTYCLQHIALTHNEEHAKTDPKITNVKKFKQLTQRCYLRLGPKRRKNWVRRNIIDKS